jgi:ABC-2 type transport system permease protein
MQADHLTVREAPAIPFDRTISLSQPIGAWTVLKATIRKDLTIARRYLPNLIASIAQLSIRLLFFLLLANIATFHGSERLGRELSGRDLFIFFQGAMLLFIFKGAALWTPVNSVTRDLYNGTLEYLYSNPFSRYAYFTGTVLSDIIIAQVAFLPGFALLVVYSGVDLINIFMILLVCLLVFFTLLAMGVMIALLGIIWRQVTSIAGILDISFEMLSGAYFPLFALPLALQYFAYILPFTWGYDLVRYYSFAGDWTTLRPVWQEWAILMLFAVVYTLLSLHLLFKVERFAKKKGLHLI